MKKRCAVPVFLFPLLSCVFLTSCAVSENIPRDPASVSDTTASAMLTDGTTTAPTTTVPTTKPTEPDRIGSDQMAVQAVLDLFGTDGGTWIVESDGRRQAGAAEYTLVHVYSVAMGRTYTTAWCWVDRRTGQIYDGLLSTGEQLVPLQGEAVTPDPRTSANGVTYDLNRVCTIWMTEEGYAEERELFRSWYPQLAGAGTPGVLYIGLRDLDYDGQKEWIVFADGGSGQEGTLYVLGIADDTVLWHSCRPFACGNPPPAVGAVTSPESPDLLLLGDFVWDWTAEKTDAA